MNLQQLLSLEGKTLKKDKGDYVFRQGDTNTSLYFVESGLLKASYTSADGKSFVKSFLLPTAIIGSLTSAYAQQTCSFSLLCLEASVLTEIPFNILQKYSREDIELANNTIEVLLSFAMKKEQREFEFLCLSAQDRFTKLMETSPELLEKVTQNDLAAYLGITAVALSRIKGRMSKH